MFSKVIGSELVGTALAADSTVAALLAKAGFGFAVVDTDGAVQMINDALARIVRWPTGDAAVGSSLAAQIIERFPAAASGLKMAFIGSGSSTLNIGASSDRYLVHLDSIRSGQRTLLLCPAADGQAMDSSSLATILGHGRCNQISRQLLDRAIKQWSMSSSGSHALALLLVSLDRFKGANETLGYEVGDELLKLVAKRLQSITRDEDMILHLGGDEFALLNTAGEQPAGALSVGKRIVDLIGRAFLVKGHQVHIDASVGIAVLEAGSEQCLDLFQQADLAMRSIKMASGGKVRLFDSDMQDAAVRQHDLEVALHRALALKEFVLHYQPQLDLATKQIVGFEALVRWQSSQHGMVSPAEFIPLAEQIREIGAIGEWVMRKACIEAARWPTSISIAVNVSPVQFESGDLVEMIRSALIDSGLAPQRLEIEVTEGLLMSDSPAVLEQLRALQAIGLGVALDDFGTGFSSLSYLTSFPFSKLKIDRSFVQDESDRAQDLVRSILTLGRSLGLTTLAEGVETEQQYRALLEDGCDSAQGFLFGRPVPADALSGLLARTERITL